MVSITLITSWLFLSVQYVIICYCWSYFASRDNGFLPFSFWWWLPSLFNLLALQSPLMWPTLWRKCLGSIDYLVLSCFFIIKKVIKIEKNESTLDKHNNFLVHFIKHLFNTWGGTMVWTWKWHFVCLNGVEKKENLVWTFFYIVPWAHNTYNLPSYLTST